MLEMQFNHRYIHSLFFSNHLILCVFQIDMPAVRKAYKRKYDAELVDDIKHKCQHSTTKVLVEIANKTPHNWPKSKVNTLTVQCRFLRLIFAQKSIKFDIMSNLSQSVSLNTSVKAG